MVTSQTGATVTGFPYQVRLAGRLGPATAEAFSDLSVEFDSGVTLLTGTMDQAALTGVVNRVHALGLELIDVRRLCPPKR
jgi:hypothetical protein